MKAMVLAAGLGTRLRPLTNDRPKALVEVAGRTLLEITLTRLRAFGVDAAILNVHHFAGMIAEYLRQHDNFGMHIEISDETKELLDTGGGLKKAAWFFQESGGEAEPFLLHNVDIISNIDLAAMIKSHRDRNALATLAVQDRETSRYLLFEDNFQLCGRRSGAQSAEAATEWAAGVSRQDATPLAFSGIHVISPRLLNQITETGAFSIISTYLRLAGKGESILGFRADGAYWRDLGKPENVLQAAADFKRGVLSL